MFTSESIDNPEFNLDEFFDFIDKNVLGDKDYVSIGDFSSGYHLGVMRRTGLDAIEVILSFINGETRIVKKTLRGQSIIILRGSILFESNMFLIENGIKLDKLEEKFRLELVGRLEDLEYALMGTDLDWE